MSSDDEQLAQLAADMGIIDDVKGSNSHNLIDLDLDGDLGGVDEEGMQTGAQVICYEPPMVNIPQSSSIIDGNEGPRIYKNASTGSLEGGGWRLEAGAKRQ